VEIVDDHQAERNMSNSDKLRTLVHPGEILRENLMNLTANSPALDLRIRATRFADIVYQRHVRLEFWLNLQNFYDWEVARRSGTPERHVDPEPAARS
jgi:plasmid maintenance system antidote protein VapI